MEEFIIDYQDTNLNKLDLDNEFAKQADLMGKYSKQLSIYNQKVNDKRENIEEKKRELKYLEATVDLDYRSEKRVEEGVKITEKSVANLVIIDPEVIALQKEISGMNRKLYVIICYRDKLEGMVSSMRQKKTALENEITLYLSGYFSEPKQKVKNESMRFAQKQKLNNKEI